MATHRVSTQWILPESQLQWTNDGDGSAGRHLHQQICHQLRGRTGCGQDVTAGLRNRAITMGKTCEDVGDEIVILLL